jgi:aminopeptidase
MALTFEQQLQNYADLAVNLGVGLRTGQRLIVRAPVESAPLLRLIAASAYRAGARLVDVLWSDDAITLARFQHAPRDSFEEFPVWRTAAMAQAAEQGDAFLSISAEDPDLLKDQDPNLITLSRRTAETHMRPFRRQLMADATNWSIISYPLPAWAAKVFPADPPEEQLPQLWSVIFKTCRIDQPDPLAAWQEHVKQLAARRDYLNARQYTALKFTGPGTNLTLGLPRQHHWHSGQKETVTGLTYIPNIPTEEVFAMPHKDQAEGVVTSTKPLSYAGVLIEEFSLTFARGRVVKVTAKKGEAILEKLVATDDGAARLGEVALVPHSSPISQSGLLFYNTLFDENASSHLALGRAYRFCLENGPAMSDDEFGRAGGNDSLVHVDFMIGSGEMDIDGLTADGAREPVMRNGEWSF